MGPKWVFIIISHKDFIITNSPSNRDFTTSNNQRAFITINNQKVSTTSNNLRDFIITKRTRKGTRKKSSPKELFKGMEREQKRCRRLCEGKETRTSQGRCHHDRQQPPTGPDRKPRPVPNCRRAPRLWSRRDLHELAIARRQHERRRH